MSYICFMVWENGADTMSDRARKISQQALELDASERIALVEDVLESLHATDPSLDHQWAKEAQDRLDAFRRGEIGARDIREIAAKYRPA